MEQLLKKAKLLTVLFLVISFQGCDEDDVVLPPVIADFSYTLNSATGTVSFINTSEEASSYKWDFGNGETSTEINPIRKYTSGTYTVTLEASNVSGAKATFTDEITVQLPTPDPGPDFDSGLLTNGDFENGTDPWIGNGANVVTEGGNSFNLVNVETAGNPFDVNLSQVVELVQGTNYILTFDASSDQERTILAGLGLNESPFTNTAPEVNLTTSTQTFTLQLAANDFGGANSRVLFDMGAAVGTVVIDNVSLVAGGDGSDTNGGGESFDSGLLTNGDFESGEDPWIGGGLNIVTEGGNSFNSVDVTVAGNPFDVNLSQVVEITQGTNYILTFEASASVARTMLAGIGLNEAPFSNTAPEVNLTTDTQTFTLQLAANDFGGANSRVLFDMGAAVGTVVIDNVSLVVGGDGSDTNGGGVSFDSGLLTNGDFENGAEPWIIGVGTDPVPVITDGDNTYYSVDVTNAGNSFDVNMSQKLEIVQGATYTLTFDAWSDRSRSIVAGIGLSGGDFSNTVETVNIDDTRTTYTLTLTAAAFGAADARVLFDSGAEVGLVNIDNVSLVLETSGGGGSGGGGSSGELALNGDFETGDDTGYQLFQNGGSAALDNTINNGGSWSGRIATNGPSNPAFKQERIGSGTVQAGDVVQIQFDHIGTIVQPGAVFNVLLFGEGAGGASFTHVFSPAPALSGTWTTFTGSFTIPNGTDVSEGISFLIEGVCGGDAGCSVTANIDNISVTLNP